MEIFNEEQKDFLLEIKKGMFQYLRKKARHVHWEGTEVKDFIDDCEKDFEKWFDTN